MLSVQADLVPYLVKHQHVRDMSRYVERGRNRSESQALAMEMSHSAPRREADDVYRCYVSIAPAAAYCKRISSVRAYKDCNAELATVPAADVEDELLPLLPNDNAAVSLARHFPRAQLAQSFLASSVSLPAEQPVSVRRSVIGRNVRIGAGVKCSGSVVMDGVVLEDGVVLTDSIVSEGSFIGKGSTLVACRIGPRYTIPAASEHKNEELCHERS
jgi:ADP-glucose pyrophosphorylase